MSTIKRYIEGMYDDLSFLFYTIKNYYRKGTA